MSLAASVQEICEWTGGRLLRGQPEQQATGTVIDSRQVGAGDLFVAIVGPNHDAHRFLGSVLLGDVAGALIQSDRIEDTLPPGAPFLIHVDDTTQALADLARGHRRSFQGPLIGITGSNGKTTTKELCAGILAREANTLATIGNLNNNFGVPLTLLRRENADAYAVVEMGMNHRGEIAVLAEIARPTIGILTNVGTAHIEFLGSRENIAEEKGDLLAALPEAGVAILGRDDPLAFAQARRTAARTLSFGRDPQADLRASKVRRENGGRYAFQLETPFGRGEVQVSGLSETIVENALAAAGGSLAAGLSFEAVAAGLAGHQGVPGRMQPRSLAALPEEVLLIDDSYNANPQSMRSALDTLAELETGGARYAVLGPMGELGQEAEAAHAEVGRMAGSLGIDGLFLFDPSGSGAAQYAEGAEAAGMSPDRIHVAKSHDALARDLAPLLSKGDCVLIKGSRAAGMENMIPLLEEAAR